MKDMSVSSANKVNEYSSDFGSGMFSDQSISLQKIKHHSIDQSITSFQCYLDITSNFSISHNVFYPFEEPSSIFIKSEIVACKLFQFGRV